MKFSLHALWPEHKCSFHKMILIMKLSLVLLIISITQASAVGYAQKITLSKKNVSLEQVFWSISNQSQYEFIYDSEMLKEAKNLNVNFKNSNLEAVLDECFKNQPLTYTIYEKIVIVKRKAIPNSKLKASDMNNIPIEIPPIVVKGRVVDVNGETLPGVSIRIKGTTVGATTDINGNFSLTVPDNSSVLTFTYIGFISQDVPVNGRTEISVVLQLGNTALNEVVVTALGIERESKSLTYSAQTIQADKLNEAKETNMINSLQGKIAGVVITRNATGPGSSSKVLLRGSRSISGNNQPLYVIDGVPMDNTSREQGPGGSSGGRDGGDGIGMINSDDIESMTVLKGASAAALYGSQGQNGAIIITTKRGKSGKISVDYTSNATFDQPNIMPELQTEYGQGNAGTYSAVSENSWGPKITGQQVTLWNGNQTNMTAYPDRIKDFYRTAGNFTNTIGISGGTDKIRTYFSYGNNRAEGILRNHEYRRNNIDFKIENDISKKLSMFTKLSYIQEDVDNKPFTSERNEATSRIYYAPVSIPPSEMQKYEYFDALGSRKQSYWSPGSLFLGNPYWALNRQLFFEKKDRVLGLFSAKYRFNDWIDLQLRASIDQTIEETEEQIYEDSYNLLGFGEVYTLFNGKRRSSNVDALLSIKRDISPAFNISGYLGASLQESTYKSNQALANGLNKQDFFFMGNAQNPQNINAYGRTPQVQSVYGTASIAFKNYLYLDVTARNDWSSALPKENQSYFYPSIGLTNIITDMIALPKWVSYGKARVSLASAGYGGIEYLTDNYYSVGIGGVIVPPGTRSLGNYKPEITNTFEAGLDWRFFGNRFGFDFTYYRTNTTNQLITLAVPNASTFRNEYINAGLLRNSGVELMLNGTPLKSDKFSWDVMLNYSKNVNKGIRLTDELKTFILGDDRQVLQTVSEGGTYGEMYMASWRKDAQGRRLVSPAGVPLILTTKTAYVGNYNPDYMLGVSNSFNFSNLSMSFLLDYRHGGTVVGGTQAAMDGNGTSKNSLMGRAGGIVLDAYTEAGVKNTANISAETYFQAVGNRTPIGDLYAYSGTNLRLREVALGYKIPNKLVSRSGFIQSAKLSLVGRNLVFFKRDAPFDPEIATAVSNRGGIEYASLPSTRNFGLNLKLSF